MGRHGCAFEPTTPPLGMQVRDTAAQRMVKTAARSELSSSRAKGNTDHAAERASVNRQWAVTDALLSRQRRHLVLRVRVLYGDRMQQTAAQSEL